MGVYFQKANMGGEVSSLGSNWQKKLKIIFPKICNCFLQKFLLIFCSPYSTLVSCTYLLFCKISEEISEFWKQHINFGSGKLRIFRKKYTPMLYCLNWLSTTEKLNEWVEAEIFRSKFNSICEKLSMKIKLLDWDICSSICST